MDFSLCENEVSIKDRVSVILSFETTINFPFCKKMYLSRIEFQSVIKHWMVVVIENWGDVQPLDVCRNVQVKNCENWYKNNRKLRRLYYTEKNAISWWLLDYKVLYMYN